MNSPHFDGPHVEEGQEVSADGERSPCAEPPANSSARDMATANMTSSVRMRAGRVAVAAGTGGAACRAERPPHRRGGRARQWRATAPPEATGADRRGGPRVTAPVAARLEGNSPESRTRVGGLPRQRIPAGGATAAPAGQEVATAMRVALLEGTHLILSGRWIADPTAAPFLGDVARPGAREWLDGGRAFVFGDKFMTINDIIKIVPCYIMFYKTERREYVGGLAMGIITYSRNTLSELQVCDREPLILISLLEGRHSIINGQTIP